VRCRFDIPIVAFGDFIRGASVQEAHISRPNASWCLGTGFLAGLWMAADVREFVTVDGPRGTARSSDRVQGARIVAIEQRAVPGSPV
jgi:hypothetical protein